MKITVVCSHWPTSNRTGVPIAAAEHVRMLAEEGYEVSIVGSHPAVMQEPLPVVSRLHVHAAGSGALYSPARVDRQALRAALRAQSPDLMIAEAWQTALTDAAIETATRELGLRTLMVSHGVAVSPFTAHALDRLRALGWAGYRRRRLPRLVAMPTVLTALDARSASPRFLDRDLARDAGVRVLPLVNAPVHWSPQRRPLTARRPQIVLIGYFTRIKNQLAAIEAMTRLPTGLRLLLIGERNGRYYRRCLEAARRLGLHERVDFKDDRECNIAEEIARSLIVLSTSITEALPIVLLEAMASGTPFVASPVGAVASLGAGIVSEVRAQHDAMRRLFEDASLWEALSQRGLRSFELNFSRMRVKQQLLAAVAACVSSRAVGVGQTCTEET